MKQTLGQSKSKGDDFLSVLPWALLGGAAGWGIYMLVKGAMTPAPGPGKTQAAALPPLAPPSAFPNFAAIVARFDEVKELYRMGYLSPEQALGEINVLLEATRAYGTPTGDRIGATAAMLSFQQDVREYVVMQQQGVVGPSPGMSGR